MYQTSSQPIHPAVSQLNYTLQIADTVLIHAQRLGEWCGHGPILEQDIAMTNTALDHIGAARSLYQLAANQFNALPEVQKKELFNSPALQQQLDQKGKAEEDDMAYLRDAWDFKNVLLAEQANEDWAYTVARSFFLDAFNYYFYSALQKSKDAALAAIAEKSVKESAYHLKWSSEWVIRLGDGTEESHIRLQNAVNDRWSFIGELFTPSAADMVAQATGYGVDLALVKMHWMDKVQEIFKMAQISIPENTWMQQGGKEGMHSEHLGYVLAEMQYMQRTYPGMAW